MMGSLLRLRFQTLFAGMTRQNRKTGRKKGGKGMIVIFILLYLYVAVVLCGAMGLLFYTLAEPYHALGLDWLYFAMAGTMALGFSVIGSVFTTQSQLYDAKDNDLLLSMPISPAKILLSRILPLMALNLLFAAIVMAPAMAVYAVVIRFSPAFLLMQLLCLLAVVLFSQAIACIFGWGLHLLLSKLNKSIASILYTVVFLGLYFTIYPQMNRILASMAVNGEAIAGAMQAWAWPMYAMGRGALGGIGYLAVFLAVCGGIFALVYWLLSATFLRTATMKKGSRRRRLNLTRQKTGTAASALLMRELKRFLGCPVYLTNMGIGLLMIPALTVAGILLRPTLTDSLSGTGLDITPFLAPAVCAILSSINSMLCISAPSVSLEGKHLWIVKSMPVSSRQILQSKLNFHCSLATPVTALCGLVLALVYGCSFWDAALCAILPGLLTVLCGLLGLICDLKWARLDWLSEAYPCKQAAPLAITMFSMMGVPLLLIGGFILTLDFLSSTWFLLLVSAVLAAICVGLYRALVTWGVRKWNAL